MNNPQLNDERDDALDDIDWEGLDKAAKVVGPMNGPEYRPEALGPQTAAPGAAGAVAPDATTDDLEAPVDMSDGHDVTVPPPPDYQPAKQAQAPFDYTSVLAGKPMPEDLSDDALKQAQNTDLSNYYSTRVSDGLSQGTNGRRVDSALPPSAASALLQRRGAFQAEDDKGRATRLKLFELSQKANRGEDPSLVERRRLLGQEAADRAQLARDRLDRDKTRDASDNEHKTAEDKRRHADEDRKKAADDAKAAGGDIKAEVDAILASPEAQKWPQLMREKLKTVTSREGLKVVLGTLKQPKGKAPPSAESKIIADESHRFVLSPTMKLEPRPGTAPNKYTLQKASEIAVPWGGALKAMDNLEGALQAYADNPSLDSARTVGSKVQTTAASMNAAIGGGAMSEAELKNVSNALGADLSSSAGIQAFVQSLSGSSKDAARTLLAKLHAAREVNEAVLEGKLRVNYVITRGGGAKMAPSSGAAPVKGSSAEPAPGQSTTVRIRRKSGGPVKSFPRAAAEELLAKHGEEFEVAP